MMTKRMQRARTRVDVEVCGGVLGHDCGYWNVHINLECVHIGSKIVTSRDLELHVNNKYRLGHKIGSGSFDEIYLGFAPFFFVHSMSNCFVDPIKY